MRTTTQTPGATGTQFRKARFVGVLLAVLMAFGIAEPLVAQAGAVPSLRPYWHVFVAYAILWALVMGWAVAIGRRLARVEKRLSTRMDDPGS